MMCPFKFIGCGGNADDGETERARVCGAWAPWEQPVLSAQFCSELETDLKSSLFLKSIWHAQLLSKIMYWMFIFRSFLSEYTKYENML